MFPTKIGAVLSCFLLASVLSACGGGSSSPEPSPSSQAGSSSQSSSSRESVSSASSEQSASSASAELACGANSPGTVTASGVEAAPVVDCVVVDQFGYLPEAQKIAVLRDPQTGFDSQLSFAPGSDYAVVNIDSDEVVHTGSPSAWQDGATSDIAGDRAWWFDFSSVSDPGRYVVWDRTHNVRSPAFSIGEDVYAPVLKDAVRTFFYQRAGHEKTAQYAGAEWADDASHLQDEEARLYSAEGDASTERDLRGGWYDAGDYNKYTNWHADYLVVLMHTYLENPSIWTDDFNIPESGNGIPDLLDELKWGMDWLKRMQDATENGSVLSVMGLDHASPPSEAMGRSVYGPATTAATLTSAQAFALGSEVFAEIEDWEDYASDLEARAEQAWNWAQANPSVTFRNSDHGVAAGEQEVDNAGRALKRRVAAIYLFAATGNTDYRSIVDSEYGNHPITWVGPWNEPETMHWLYYAGLTDATDAVASDIRSDYTSAMGGNWSSVNQNQDAYRAYLSASDFTWGSNRTMSRQGLTFTNLASHQLGDASDTDIDNAALGYVNYLHGTNPLAKVYLSNMYHLEVHNSVNSFYHSWFADGSPDWDSVQESNYGPAPGFLVGGPNPAYDWDQCCPDDCGAGNNAKCGPEPLAPPAGQPPAKAYADFNTSWPINSWQVTENHNDYQVAYIRLLSKFVR